MPQQTLFSSLASYSQNAEKRSIENFTTEVMAYLINNDQPFRRIFINHLIHDKRLRGVFRKASAETQKSFPRGRVDLVLNAPNGRKVLVEVKVSSGETMTRYNGNHWKPQVKKYISYHAGKVAYLTTRRTPSPEDVGHSKEFLGQTYFEELYAYLCRLKNPSKICQLFIDFMEEQNMTPPEPLTKNDIYGALGAFDFAKKCEDILNETRERIIPEFRRLFRSKARFTSGHFSPEYGAAYFYTKHFHRGPIKSVWVCMEPDQNELLFTVCARVEQHPTADALEKKLRWDVDGRYLCKGLFVHGDGKDTRRMVSHAVKSFKELKRAIARI